MGGGVVVGSLLAAGTSSDGGPGEVDLSAEELAGAGDGGEHRAPCVPSGCARWFAPVGPGVAAHADGSVFHLGRDQLTALDADDGSLRWQMPVEGPDGAGPPVGGGLDVVDGLVVHRAHRWVRAHDTETGETRFTTGLAPQRFPRAVTRANDGLVVTGTLHADHHGSPYEFVALLDAHDGSIRWSREVHRVWAAPHGLLADAPADRRSVVDPRDGGLRVGVEMEELWRAPRPVVLQPDADRVAVLEPSDGGLRWVRGLDELAAHGSVAVVADRGDIRELVDLGSGRRHVVAGDDEAGTQATVDHDGDHLRLSGPVGTILVTGPARVAARAPLLVSTSEGLLAVDETRVGHPAADGP